MRQYHDLLRLVLEHGQPRSDRTGVGTLSVFGAQARFDLRGNFPLLTHAGTPAPASIRGVVRITHFVWACGFGHS